MSFSVSDAVHAARDGNGDLVLLNQATGNWHKLNRTGTAFFEVLRSGADVEQAVTVLAERHSHIPPTASDATSSTWSPPSSNAASWSSPATVPAAARL